MPWHCGFSLSQNNRFTDMQGRSLGFARDDDAGGARLTFIIFRSADLCLYEALYPAPLARPFFKGLLSCHAISKNPIHRPLPHAGKAKR